jgi:predicted O-methyltransferase YrrM
VLSVDTRDIPSARGWSVASAFDNPRYGEAFLQTLKRLEEDEMSAGLSDVGIRNLLFTHILNLRPQSVLEIGTHIGSGSVVMGQALKVNGFGKLYSVEPNSQYRHRAETYLQDAGLAEWATIVPGFSSDASVRRELEQKAPFELIFVDANHNYEVVRHEIQWYWQILAANGFMLFHDSGVYATSFDTEGGGGVRRALNEAAKELEDFKLLMYEWPLWLNPCGAAIAWKEAPAPRPNL